MTTTENSRADALTDAQRRTLQSALDLFVAMGHAPGSDHVRTLAGMLAKLSSLQPAPAPCVHADDPKSCYRVRCQLGGKCVDDDMSPRQPAAAPIDDEQRIEAMARAMNVATDGHDRYWTGYVRSATAALRALRKLHPAPSPADERAATAWQTGTPPTKAGDYDEYIVAVRRKAVPGRVFVFASNYANDYGKEELSDQDGSEYIADGWYTIGHDTSGEFDSLFMPMLEPGDEVIGWQSLPKWDDGATARAESASETGAEVSGECFIVIGHGESDIPEAKIVTRRDDLLDAVLGMIYSSPSDAPDDVRAEYAEALADEDEWAADTWSVSFEIGGIVVWHVGLHPFALPRSPAIAVEAPEELPHWFEMFLTNVCELPDRNSPEGEPDAIVATLDELRNCALNAIEQCVSYAAPQPAQADAPASKHAPHDDPFKSSIQGISALLEDMRDDCVARLNVGDADAMVAAAFIMLVRKLVDRAFTESAAQASYDGNHVENHCPECSQYESECECAQADARVGLTDEQIVHAFDLAGVAFPRDRGNVNRLIAAVRGIVATLPGQPEPRAEVTNPFRDLLAALIDIYDDERNNAPEDRCYVEGAWSEVLGEARALLAPLPDPAQVDAESPDWIKNALPPEGA
ncbi:hypothetical protein [Burkholderia orbicola]|uniref:hypothetical protein n=1 Tax=Burkholderia orbicola TaxID=2978683 RepID=UPI002FE01C32